MLHLGLFTFLGLLAFGGDVPGYISYCERLTLSIGIQQAQRMLAGELPAGAGAAEHWLIRHNEVRRALIRRFSASRALPEQQFPVLRTVQLHEAFLLHQPLTILHGSGVGCERIYIR